VDYTFFVAFSKQTHGTLIQVYVLKIESHKLAETHSAVEEKGYDTVIPVVVRILLAHIFKQLYAVVQGKELRQMLVHFGVVDIFCWIVRNEVKVAVKALVEHFERGKLAVSCFGGIASVCGDIA
jgi:hypothetical protein